jgi:uncharacterized protein YijF (DUF1287 family)
MLVSNSRITAGDIVAFKLVNGDEVIGKVVEHRDESYQVDRPMVIIPGSKGLMLMQAMFSLTKDKAVEINKEHVMMTCDVVDELHDHYIETTTGIKPITKGSIITS